MTSRCGPRSNIQRNSGSTSKFITTRVLVASPAILKSFAVNAGGKGAECKQPSVMTNAATIKQQQWTAADMPLHALQMARPMLCMLVPVRHSAEGNDLVAPWNFPLNNWYSDKVNQAFSKPPSATATILSASRFRGCLKVMQIIKAVSVHCNARSLSPICIKVWTGSAW